MDPLLHNLYISGPTSIYGSCKQSAFYAIKFTPSGGITLAVGYASSRLSITINDTGKGMDSDEKKEFFRNLPACLAHRDRKVSDLPFYCQKVSPMLERNIEVDSIPGKGSTFTVHLHFIL